MSAPACTRRRRAALGAAVGVIAWRPGWCNEDIAQAWREMGVAASLMTPPQAVRWLVPGDVALNRLDVTPDLAGVEPGMAAVGRLQRAGIRVLNPPDIVTRTHDKLETARRLARACVPQPETAEVALGDSWPQVAPPVVLKPRYGSWGHDVVRCTTARELAAWRKWAARRPWYHRGGAIIQEFVPHQADLRLVVANGEVVGAVERRAALGEWRTNFSLGGSRWPVLPPAAAGEIARAAARAVRVDMAGVDLVVRGGDWIVIEVNGAVDFDRLYSLPGRDVYEDVAEALALPVCWHLPAHLHHRCGWTHALPRVTAPALQAVTQGAP